MVEIKNLPRFNIELTEIAIIDTPSEFFSTLQKSIQAATSKISLASLYIGSELVLIFNQVVDIEDALRRGVQVEILVDYFRGTRSGSSYTIFKRLCQQYPAKIRVSLYHSPRGITNLTAVTKFIKFIVPQRFIEAFGLQHMKFYVVDDCVIISGANLSKDYFHNRQDRYIKIANKSLVAYYSGLLQIIQSISFVVSSRGDLIPPIGFADLDFERRCCEVMSDFCNHWMIKTQFVSADEPCVVYPALQMNVFKVTQDRDFTVRLFNNPDHKIHILTAYFNIPKQLTDCMIKSKSSFNLITSAPESNGFFKSRGISQYIPTAYSYLESLFLRKVERSNLLGSIKLFEYRRPGYTWHGKGIYALSTKNLSLITTIGSSNMNQRSLYRDLESQLIICTSDPSMKAKLMGNLDSFYTHSSQVSLSKLSKRKFSIILRGAVMAIKSML